MTETERTTITLNSSIMNEIDELVGGFGSNRAQVISNIVELFLNNKKNEPFKEKMKERKRKNNKPKQEIVDPLIENILKGADYIPLDSFLTYLGIGKEFFYMNNYIWSQKHKYLLKEDKIIKITS